ncbi:MAG: hypothetical protein LBQ01_07915 [Prevotellaceae bacterium]|jgi:hypothetical protein|nr:hypothetical protein [Prevotellaceae bacterium]
MKQLLFIIICVLSSTAVAGQYTFSKERPQWVDGFFKEAANSYIEVVSDVGYDEENARNKAAKMIAERRSRVTGQEVSVNNGNVQITANDKLIVKARIIDEYIECRGPGDYRAFLLVQTAKNPSLTFEGLDYTPKYPFSPRVFVPGMAQLYKGSTAKGILFIAGEAVLIGGVVVAENLRASYNSKLGSTHSAADMKSYISNADNCKNIRNGLIAGAAALYVWNVIDGCVAKGRKHVVVLGDNTLKIMPFATPYNAGVSLAFNF